MNKTQTIITAATVGYLIYDNKQLKSEIEKDLEKYDNKIEEVRDESIADKYALENLIQEEIDKVTNYTKASDIEISYVAEVSSIVSKHWNMGGSITIKNKSDQPKKITGITLQWSYKGIECNWALWWMDGISATVFGGVTLQPNQEHTFVFQGANHHIFINDHANRLIVRDALKGNSKTWHEALGHTIDVTATINIFQLPIGYETTNLKRALIENVKGLLKYESYCDIFKHNNKTNGLDVEWFKNATLLK